LVTPHGSADVQVPRLRDGSYDHKTLDPNGLVTPETRERILETYLAGVSTRRTGAVLEKVLGTKVSESTVSAICKGLDEQVRKYWRREIGDGCAGLIAAIEAMWPDVPHQRCWAHKLRNVASKLKKANQKKVSR
jgi:transposase-like protein